MKKIIIPVLILSLGIVACGGSNEEAIATEITDVVESAEEVILEEPVDDLYHSVDGRFKIKFQGEPKVASDIVPTDAGNIEMASFMYEKSATEAYMVAYSDYPSEMVKKSSVDEMLLGAKNGSSGNLGITKFDLEEKIELDGNKGLYFRGSAGSIYVEYKIYLVANRLYQVAILRDGAYSKPERSDEFFDSFQLVKQEVAE